MPHEQRRVKQDVPRSLGGFAGNSIQQQFHGVPSESLQILGSFNQGLDRRTHAFPPRGSIPDASTISSGGRGLMVYCVFGNLVSLHLSDEDLCGRRDWYQE